jgi:hypothetical protein
MNADNMRRVRLGIYGFALHSQEVTFMKYPIGGSPAHDLRAVLSGMIEQLAGRATGWKLPRFQPTIFIHPKLWLAFSAVVPCRFNGVRWFAVLEKREVPIWITSEVGLYLYVTDPRFIMLKKGRRAAMFNQWVLACGIWRIMRRKPAKTSKGA